MSFLQTSYKSHLHRFRCRAFFQAGIRIARSNVEAELNVFEGMSHISFILNPYAPESREVFTDWARFFDKHLGH